MLIGRQTWTFPAGPRVLGTGTAVGALEAEGPLGSDFDLVHADLYVGQESWEKAERKLFEEAQAKALEKSGLGAGDITLAVTGDNLPQNIASNFSARTGGWPLLGTFSACATSMEAVALAAALVDAGQADRVMAGASSHNSTAERTFRFPTEYGAQKPATAHCTVTGAGAVVIGKGIAGARITHATIGKVIDLGVKSPWEMGAAMAPAAADTIACHFSDTRRGPEDFDAIVTGDLARVGHPIARDLLLARGHDLGSRFFDCGVLIYRVSQPGVFSGGSGPGCCACVTFAHLLPKLETGEWRRMMVVATGALLSTVSAQQGETIPCIAHAVVFEADGSAQPDGAKG